MKIGEQLFYQGKEKIKSPVVITHRNCPDGSAAAVLAKKMDPSTFWFPVTHYKVNDQVLKTAQNVEMGRIYLVDISCDQKTLTKVLEIVKDKQVWIGIYDHHETTKWLKDFVLPGNFPPERIEILFDHDRCGSKIFYDRYCCDFEILKDYRDFIELNNDRDLWLQKDQRSEDLARLHEILQDEGYVERFLSNPSLEFDDQECCLLQYVKMNENQKHEKLLRNIQIKKDEEGYKYGVVYGETDGSNLLNKAIERFNLEYALLINLNTKRASIRSRGNKDCTAYAGRYGGGGHRCASGFQIQFQEPQF